MVNQGYTQELFTKTVRFRVLLNGVVHYTYLSKVEVTEVDHMENFEALKTLSKGEKLKLIVDSNGFVSLTPEAKKLVRKLEVVAPIEKRAFVARNLGEKIMTNFYLTFYKPIIPTKVFTNYNAAFEWLFDNKKGSMSLGEKNTALNTV